MNAAETRHHITFKAVAGDLAGDVADRMLAALDAGAEPDYATLLDHALFVAPPSRVFHTAPSTARAAIRTSGLVPGHGQNWHGTAAGQPAGVYVGATPDLRGLWAHWESWDIWEIDLTGLPWSHDRLNPGCWVLGPVPPTHLSLRCADASHAPTPGATP